MERCPKRLECKDCGARFYTELALAEHRWEVHKVTAWKRPATRS